LQLQFASQPSVISYVSILAHFYSHFQIIQVAVAGDYQLILRRKKRLL